MLHYIAMVWNEADKSNGATAEAMFRRFQEQHAPWTVAVNGDGLKVMLTSTAGPLVNKAYLLEGKQGIVIGRLFERGYVAGTVPASIEFGKRRTRDVVASGGRSLISDYWGQYIAFIRDSRSRRTSVLRDPTGGVPCLTTRVSGIDIYFERFEDCERLGIPQPSINRSYLAGRLAYNAVGRRESGLDGIFMVLPGECIWHRNDGRESSFYWSPLEIASSRTIEDPAEAIRETYDTVRACVHAWASCFEGISHSLSGGLDSSIVLACLADAPTRPRIVCLNDYSAGSDSDERIYARLSAQKAGCELIERERVRETNFGLLRELPKSPYPFPWCVDPKLATKDAQIELERGLVAQFSGDGGDELFHRTCRLPASADFAYRHRLRSPLLALMLDDATRIQVSFWYVLKIAMKYGWARRPWVANELWSEVQWPLLSPWVFEKADGDKHLIHPLYERSPMLPPGKIDQAYNISMVGMRSHNPLVIDHHPASIAPLYSQPLIELSLRIPVDVLTVGGCDRAIARKAFEKDIPPQIAWRTAKGGVEEFVKEVIGHNAVLFRDLLLDGFLVREGYLDRAKLHEMLSGKVTNINTHSVELINYLTIEAWARSWYDEKQRIAA